MGLRVAHEALVELKAAKDHRRVMREDFEPLPKFSVRYALPSARAGLLVCDGVSGDLAERLPAKLNCDCIGIFALGPREDQDLQSTDRCANHI